MQVLNIKFVGEVEKHPMDSHILTCICSADDCQNK